MNVIVAGCGRMGSRLAQRLSVAGEQVTVMDQDEHALARLGRTFKGRAVRASGLDRSALVEAGIARADAVVALMDSDDENLVVARAARELFRVPTAVARVYDPRKAEIFLRLGVHTFSTITWGVNRICETLHASQWVSHTSLGTGDVELLEASLPAALAGHAARDVDRAGEIQVVAVTRHGRTFLAVPGSVLEEGDVLHIAAAGGANGRLASLGLS